MSRDGGPARQGGGGRGRRAGRGRAHVATPPPAAHAPHGGQTGREAGLQDQGAAAPEAEGRGQRLHRAQRWVHPDSHTAGQRLVLRKYHIIIISIHSKITKPTTQRYELLCTVPHYTVYTASPETRNGHWLWRVFVPTGSGGLSGQH